MPADCTCGVIAIGRCTSCGAAFCRSHVGPRLDECQPCGSERMRCQACQTPTTRTCGGCGEAYCDAHGVFSPNYVSTDPWDERLATPGYLFECPECDRARRASLPSPPLSPYTRVDAAIRTLRIAGYPGTSPIRAEAPRGFRWQPRRVKQYGVGYSVGCHPVPKGDGEEDCDLVLRVDGKEPRFVPAVIPNSTHINLMYTDRLADALEAHVRRLGLSPQQY